MSQIISTVDGNIDDNEREKNITAILFHTNVVSVGTWMIIAASYLIFTLQRMSFFSMLQYARKYNIC